MREPQKLESARWFNDQLFSKEVDGNRYSRIGVPNALDYWCVKALRVSDSLLKQVQETGKYVEQLLDSYLDPESGYDGHVSTFSEPYHIDSRLLKLIEQIQRVEPKLDHYHQQLKSIEQEIDFGRSGFYEPIARNRLSLSWRIIPRFKTFLHSHVWLFWIGKSLDQAVIFRDLIDEYGYYRELDDDAFAFIAFPAILNAALSCTAVLEEVGAEYINAFGKNGNKINTDNTSCSKILDGLDGVYPQYNEYEVELIKREVVEQRNIFSHYMTKRADSVNYDSMEEFRLGISRAFWLISRLSTGLIHRTLNDEGEKQA